MRSSPEAIAPTAQPDKVDSLTGETSRTGRRRRSALHVHVGINDKAGDRSSAFSIAPYNGNEARNQDSKGEY